MKIVSIDIGENALKMLYYSGDQVKKYIFAEMPNDMVRNGTIVSMDAMADFIRDVAKEHGIPKGKAAIILPSALVHTRVVTVPMLTEQQLRYNLPYEFKDYLETEKNKYFFDYAVLGTEQDENGEDSGFRLFACATLKSTIAEYRAMLHRAGFKLVKAIPPECSYGALFDGMEGEGEHCIVDLGYSNTRLWIYSGGEYNTSRIIDYGMVTLQQIIADEMGVDFHMARTYMNTNFENVLQSPACMEIYSQLAYEIVKAIHFFNYNNRESSLQGVYLCGGGAVIEQLREAIDQATKLDVFSEEDLYQADNKPEEPWLYVQAYGTVMDMRGED